MLHTPKRKGRQTWGFGSSRHWWEGREGFSASGTNGSLIVEVMVGLGEKRRPMVTGSEVGDSHAIHTKMLSWVEVSTPGGGKKEAGLQAQPDTCLHPRGRDKMEKACRGRKYG